MRAHDLLPDRPPSSVDDIFIKGNAYSFGRHAWAASIVQDSCTARHLEMLAIDKLLLGTPNHAICVHLTVPILYLFCWWL